MEHLAKLVLLILPENFKCFTGCFGNRESKPCTYYTFYVFLLLDIVELDFGCKHGIRMHEYYLNCTSIHLMCVFYRFGVDSYNLQSRRKINPVI